MSPIRPCASLLLAAALVLDVPGGARAQETAALEPSAALDRGRRLFLRHCASCHGPDATLGASGDITGLPPRIVIAAMRGFEQMPAVTLRESDAAAIAAWLEAHGGG